MVSLVNSHSNATRIGWHLLEFDLRFASGLPPGWQRRLVFFAPGYPGEIAVGIHSNGYGLYQNRLDGPFP